MDKAIEQYLKGYQLALAQVPAVVPQFELELGIAYLHKSEMENDIYTHPEEHESYPLTPATHLRKKKTRGRRSSIWKNFSPRFPTT